MRGKKNSFDSIIGPRVTFAFIRHTFSLTFNYALYILVTRNKWPMNNANYFCKTMKFLVKFLYGYEIILFRKHVSEEYFWKFFSNIHWNNENIIKYSKNNINGKKFNYFYFNTKKKASFEETSHQSFFYKRFRFLNSACRIIF